MEKLTYNNVRTKVAGKAAGNKNQKSVASELITALSKPKIKKEVKEELVEEETVDQGTVANKLDLKDFQATIAKNLNVAIEKEKNTIKLSNKTKNSASKRAEPKANLTESRDEKTAFKNKVNNDWINFLKKRQDSETFVEDVVEMQESPKVEPKPKRIRNIKKDSFSTNVTNAATVQVEPIPSKKVVENDSDKDLILKNLMNQVAQLESSMGANISKLELQLKEEKEVTKKVTKLEKLLKEETERTNKLLVDVESEKENYSDIATKLISLQQSKLTTEESHLKKINDFDEKLKLERSKNASLSKERSKIEKTLKEEVKAQEKISTNLVSLSSEKELLILYTDKLQKWKDESIIKIKASIMNCQQEHVQKIEDLEESDRIKGDLIVEISSRTLMLIAESSSFINLKDKEIDNLKLSNDEKENLLKEREKKVNELESKLKEKESKCREKEENEEKYKEKVDRYREKEERYREKENRFKEKEKKMKEREEKFVDLEKRLREKEKKFKENDEKLKQKEDEMFRVYELVNQLQLRMKNDKINPIVNGQDILSIGTTKSSTEIMVEDEDICILPTPVKVPEKAPVVVRASKDGINNVKDKSKSGKVYVPSDKTVREANEASENKSERKVSHDPRQRKERSRESVDVSKSNEEKSPPRLEASPAQLKDLNLGPKNAVVNGKSATRNESPRGAHSPNATGCASSSYLKFDGRRSESFIKNSSRRNSGHGKEVSVETRHEGIQDSKMINKSVEEQTIDVQSGVLPSSEKQLDMAAASNSVPEVSVESDTNFKDQRISSVSPSGCLKRKSEIEEQTNKPAKKMSIPSIIAEEEILLVDDEDDDDIQCVMEIKAPLPIYVTPEMKVVKDEIRDAVKNFLTEEKTKVDKQVLHTVEEDDSLMEYDLPEPVPCLETCEEMPSGVQSLEPENGAPLIKLNSSFRMKASDFFKDVDASSVEVADIKELENVSKIYDEGLELENWIGTQLRIERKKMECEEREEEFNDSIESISDSSQETLKKMFLLDQEIQDSDFNENQTISKPLYVNPDVPWVLKKWPNLPERLSLQSESPKPKDSECKIVHETEVQDPRLRRKHGMDAAGLDVSYQQLLAMKKVVKFDEKFHIPRSAQNLMLPYLWPMVKYVKKDLMKLFDESPGIEAEMKTKSLTPRSSQLEVIELDEEEEVVTVSLLYDDLDVEANDSDKFSTKRTWEEMNTCNLSVERSRILDELKLELNNSQNDIDESNSDLLIVSFEDESREEEPFKKVKLTCSEESVVVVNFIRNLVDECLNGVTGDSHGILEYEVTGRSSFVNVSPTVGSVDLGDVEVKKTSLNLDKPKQGLIKMDVKRRSLTRSSVNRYLGSKRC